VSKLLRSNLRYAGDTDGSRPTADAVAHLGEYALRLALRERWDLADARANAERLRRLMFAERSELIELAAVSGMVFEGDSAADLEEVLSVSDIGQGRLPFWSASSALREPTLLIESSDFSMHTPLSPGTAPRLSRTSDIYYLFVYYRPDAGEKIRLPAGGHFGPFR